jgi:nitrogen regulatory protein P-II 1
MKLLFVVLNSPEQLTEVLEGLLETGVSGATVVDSVGMGHIMEDVPLFAGVRSMFGAARPNNRMIFSVIDDGQAGECLEVLDRIIGCSREKGRGIAFTVPIDATIGVCRED